MHVTGNLTWSSDQRLKRNIVRLQEHDNLNKIMLLEPRSYQFLSTEDLKQQNLPVLNTDDKTHLGFLAQEVEQILPELVTDIMHVLGEATGEIANEPEIVSTKAIDYNGLIPVLVAAMQEQQHKIESLEARLEKIESAIQGR